MAVNDPWADIGEEIQPTQQPTMARGQARGGGMADAPMAPMSDTPGVVDEFAAIANVAPEGAPGERIAFSPDDSQYGDIGFASKASNEANSLPANAQAFQREFQALVNTPGRFNSPDEILEYATLRGFPFPREQADRAFEAMQKGIRVDVDTPTFAKPDISDVRGQEGAGFSEGVDAAGRGIAGLAGIDDEIGAIVDSVSMGIPMDQALARNRAIRDYDEENNFLPRLAGNLGAGIAIPTGAASAARSAAVQAIRSGLGREAAISAARWAVTRQLAAEGGALGAAYGAGSADGSLGDRAVGALTGGLGGAVGGGVVGGVGSLVAPGVKVAGAAERAMPSAREKFLTAAHNQNMDFLAADVPGATASRLATGITGVTLGAIPLSESAQKVIAGAAERRNQLADFVGNVVDETGAGQAAQRGARDFLKSTETRGNGLYRAIPINGDRPSVLSSTKQALGELNEGLTSNPELSGLVSDPRLQAYQRAFEGTTTQVPTGVLDASGNMMTREVKSGGELSWRDLQSFRSYIGELAGSPALQSDTSKKALKRLYAGLSDDMRATASAEGPQAIKAFNRANDYWRGRQARIEGVITDILGKDMDKGATPAFEAINRLAAKKGGDPIKLAQTLRSMPADEANSIRATILNRMGDARTINEEGYAFTPAEFVRQWDGLSDRAKSILFQNEHSKSLDEFATLMRGMKAAGKFANTSKTGLTGNAIALAASGYISPILSALTAAGQLGAGKLLGSPAVAKWINSAVKKPNERAMTQHIEGLEKIARSSPGLANEILNYQEALIRNIASPSRVAHAQDGQDHGAEPPQQYQPQ